MKTPFRTVFAATLIGAALLPTSTLAEIYTLPDITRAAGEPANNDVHYNFDPNSGWSGTPPNAISGDASLYLKFTVSWTAATDIGSFLVRFNAGDAGGAARIGAGTEGSGFALINANSPADGDGSGPATAKPTIDAVDKTSVTSATFVIKVNQPKPSPGGDWWFGNTAAQENAGHFVYINPDLGANEATQSTKWAAWRSGNGSYQSVTFRTNTADVDLNFTDIALYTGDDTPFSTAVGGVDAGTSTVSASPATVPADGSSTSTITVTVKDAGGVPVADKEVALANTAGPGTPFIDPATATSDFFGVATFTVSSATVGTEEFTATADSVVITQTASVDFTSSVTDAGNSTVAAGPGTIPADGVTESFVTVTLRNSTGQALPGKVVSVSNTSGPGTPVVEPAEGGSDTTDADGVATFRVRSTTVGVEEFTATCTTDGVTLAADVVSVGFVAPDAGGLLAYEGFDYEVGVLTGKDGGTGFSAGWASPEGAFVASVYDQTGSALTEWDNVFASGEVAMSSPPRYIATVDSQSNPQSTATRALAADAGTLAGADNVLWMGAVFHYEKAQGSAFLNFGLTSGGYITDRGRVLTPAGVDFMGVSNWAQPSNTWNTRLNATIVENHTTGTGYQAPYVQALGSVNPTETDMLVVLKYTFGTTDRVEAAFFTENESISEAAFYTHPSYVSAVYPGDIDESGLATIAYNQQIGDNAFDEVRLGNTFNDLIGLALITSFEGAGATGVINQTTKTISLVVPNGTDLSTLAPTFTLRSGTCDRISGEVPTPTFASQNPLTYTVTDTSTDPATVNAYSVTVTVAPVIGTLVIDLGPESPWTVIEGGGTIASGPTGLPLALPVGSILRGIDVDVTLRASDNGTALNFANDLALLFDPTPGAPGTDVSLGVVSASSNVDFGISEALNWTGGDGTPVTPLTGSWTDADWTTEIDLGAVGLLLGNAYKDNDWVAGQGGTWSGTITLTYDIAPGDTPFTDWATGGESFGGDANGDGVIDGIAFLLGAPTPGTDASGLLPTGTEDGGGLVLSFSCLNAANRGPATLQLQWSADLGVTDPWASNVAVVPESTTTVNGVLFQVTPNGNRNDVIATIAVGEAADGKLFGRLRGSEN